MSVQIPEADSPQPFPGELVEPVGQGVDAAATDERPGTIGTGGREYRRQGVPVEVSGVWAGPARAPANT